MGQSREAEACGQNILGWRKHAGCGCQFWQPRNSAFPSSPKAASMATLTFPVAVRAALRSGSPPGRYTWPAGAVPKRSSLAGGLDFGYGWGERKRLGGDGAAKCGEAGWCRKRQQCARPGRLASETRGPIRPPSTNARVRVPGGRGPQRRGSGWPWGGSRSAGLRRAAAARSARLDARAGGAAKPRRTDCAARAATTGGPAPGQGAGNDAVPPASLEEELPPVWSFSLFNG